MQMGEGREAEVEGLLGNEWKKREDVEGSRHKKRRHERFLFVPGGQ